MIEFSACEFRAEGLVRGRVYFKPGFYDPAGEWILKDAGLVRLGNRLINWIRRNYAKGLHGVIGPGAAQWCKETGGTLRPG